MSEYFLPVFYVVLQLLVIMGIGFFIRKSGKWSTDFFRALSRLVVRVALPFYFVVRISQTDLSQFRTMAIMPLAAIVVIGGGLLLSTVLFGILPFRGGDRRAGIAMAGFGNSGYMPLAIAEIVPLSVPLIAERFGVSFPATLIAAYVFIQSPMLWSVGRFIVTRKDGTSRLRWTDVVSPPLIGIVVGLLVAVTGLGKLIGNPALPLGPVFLALERLADITLPLALLNLGGLIGNLEISRNDWRLLIGMSGAVILVRLLIMPALFYAAYFGFLARAVAPVVAFVIFLETHTPPATNLSLMAAEAGVNEHHTSVTLLASYVLYLIVMPVYLSLFLYISS